MTDPTAQADGQKSAAALTKTHASTSLRAAKTLAQHPPAEPLDKAALLALFAQPMPQESVAGGVLTADVPDVAATKCSEHKPITSSSTDKTRIAQLRVALYESQHRRTQLLYMASASTRPTYLVQTLKPQFVEYQQYQLARQLDKRGLMDMEGVGRLWQQLHVVDDIIADIVRHMPAQLPVGWQLITQDGRNPLCLATIGQPKQGKPICDNGSLNGYVLGHFGVSSFTHDRGYYIGHVVGYLFNCYFCAHLSIAYNVMALDQQAVANYEYASLETPHMVRLLQGLDGYCKKRVYQLAVICARLSVFTSDKRIERMLIAEVNDFDKKLQQQHLDALLLQGVMPDSSDSTPLF